MDTPTPCSIISISGLIGSGKDSIAHNLIEYHDFHKVSFGSAVKDAVSAIFGWNRDMLDGYTLESREWRDQVDRYWDRELDLDAEVTPRWVLQNFATEVMRNHFHPDIWVLVVKKQIQEHLKHGRRVVLTDTRFFNEYRMLLGMNALIVGVHRRMPKWVGQFYEEMGNFIYHTFQYSPNAIDLLDPSMASTIKTRAFNCRAILDNKIHESEWQHLLWNRYDGIVDNTGTLKQLRHSSDILAAAYKHPPTDNFDIQRP
jgi:hypothetical protein